VLRKRYLFVLFVLAACVGCQWHLRPSEEEDEERVVEVERFDRIERLYLTTGDFAALQQMKTLYPSETRTLIEDMLQLGRVDEADINTRFLHFFQDSTLQALMQGVDEQYGDVSDLNSELTEAFTRLVTLIPELEIPRIYTQIGSLDQSVVVGDSLVGISLDKYLGADYPIYQRYGYTEEQRAMMTRQYIVPDCLGFYLLRHFPMPAEAADSVGLRHEHMAKIQYVVNRAMGRRVFRHDGVVYVEYYMKNHPETTLSELLSAKNHQ
jgi:hypothetical protein